MIGYIEQLAPSVEAYQKYFGVVLDGTKIGFVRFRKTWQSEGPYPVNEQTILTFLEALRGLRRKALRVEALNKDLGAGSAIAKTLVKVLYETLNSNKERNKRVEVLFDDWKRVFGQVCGYSPEKIKGLEKALWFKPRWNRLRRTSFRCPYLLCACDEVTGGRSCSFFRRQLPSVIFEKV
ncbi:MAG: hypothetical protein N2V78_00515 [Methanophagales archaeon]|nr:hypothetical protein [Methanophagales archaeon]MCW3142086.1 hypothetical protein [Methanophagales archaeon]